MINNFIEPIINKKLSIVGTIFTTPGITVEAISKVLGFNLSFCKRTIIELSHHSELALKNTNGHYYLNNTAGIIQYNSETYQQSLLLKYLSFALNNNDENTSIINVSFTLARSTSSIYGARRLANKALKEYHLKLNRNTVTGDELNKRLLIALLNVKYGFKIHPITATKRQILRTLITKHFNSDNVIVNIDNVFLLELISLGVNRSKFDDNLHLVAKLDRFKTPLFDQQVKNFIDDYFTSLNIHNSLSKSGYQYFKFIFLTASTINFTPDVYPAILQNPEYHHLYQDLLKSAEKVLNEDAIQEIVTYIFKRTFITRCHYITAPQTEIAQSMLLKLNPQLKYRFSKTLQTSLHDGLDSFLVTDFTNKLQSTFLSNYQFRLNVIVCGINKSLMKTLKDTFSPTTINIIQVQQIDNRFDFNQYITPHSGLVLILPINQRLEFNVSFFEEYQNFSSLLTISNRNTSQIPVTVFQQYLEMKDHALNHYLSEKFK